MKTVKKSDFVTKLAVFLLIAFCTIALRYTNVVTSKIAVEVNDSFSDVENRPLSQKLINIILDGTDTGYLLAQANIGKPILASLSVDGSMGRINIVIKGDWIYYPNTLDGGKLYRIKTDGNGRQKLNNDCSGYINVTGDRIYYRNCSDVSKLYTIKTDGSDRQKLNDDMSWDINVLGDQIYYFNGNDGNKLYRINTDGSDMQKLSDD